MDRNIDRCGKPVKKEEFMLHDRQRIPFIVEGVFDNGANYIKKRVVVMALSEYDAKRFARKHLEKRSDDCFKVVLVRQMTNDDVIVEDC